MDEANRRLFVVTRAPGRLLVLNADTGATLAELQGARTHRPDHLGSRNRRVYVTGGEGYISVVQEDDPDHFGEVASVPSAPGAKTAVLDSAHHKLFVAASPGDTGAMGKVLVYDVGAR